VRPAAFTLRLTNLNPSDVLLSHIGTDLMVDVLATGERIEVDEHFWSTTSNYGIERIEFGGGTIWDRAKISSETWYRGTASTDTLTGSNFDDHMAGEAGNDTLNGGSGSDFLDGGLGNDTMSGSTGDDIYVLGEVGDTVTEASGQGTDEVRTTLASYTLGSNVENLRYTGSVAFTGTGNTFNNQLLGGTSDDVLNASGGDDTLDGRTGNDTLIGGAGNDVYLFSRGDGQDIIANQDADTLTTDRLQFGDVNVPDDVWLGRIGDDLIVSILGSADRIRLTSWYTDAASQLDEFAISDGRTLNRSAVDQLVSAMASFTGTDGVADGSVQPGSVPSSVQLAINNAWSSGA
jgi:Ca2+-binding RTX toxin-like protein